jgi:hypothetical protein
LCNPSRLSPQFDPEKLRELGPAFEGDGTVTAGNASQISDGAAVLVLTSAAFAEKHDLRPLFRISGFGDAAQSPEKFPTTPSLAIPRAVKNAGKRLEDVDFFEINEAFSVSGKNRELVELVTPVRDVNQCGICGWKTWILSKATRSSWRVFMKANRELLTLLCPFLLSDSWYPRLEDVHFLVINEAFSGTSRGKGPGAVKLLTPFLVIDSVWYARIQKVHFSRINEAFSVMLRSAYFGSSIFDDMSKVKEQEASILF